MEKDTIGHKNQNSMPILARYDLARFGPAMTGHIAEVITLPRCRACFISAISEREREIEKNMSVRQSVRRSVMIS